MDMISANTVLDVIKYGMVALVVIPLLALLLPRRSSWAGFHVTRATRQLRAHRATVSAPQSIPSSLQAATLAEDPFDSFRSLESDSAMETDDGITLYDHGPFGSAEDELLHQHEMIPFSQFPDTIGGIGIAGDR